MDNRQKTCTEILSLISTVKRGEDGISWSELNSLTDSGRYYTDDLLDELKRSGFITERNLSCGQFYWRINNTFRITLKGLWRLRKQYNDSVHQARYVDRIMMEMKNNKK